MAGPGVVGSIVGASNWDNMLNLVNGEENDGLWTSNGMSALQESQNLFLYNFGFDLPPGCTVLGYQLSLKPYATSQFVSDLEAFVVMSDTNDAATDLAIGAWPLFSIPLEARKYGSAGDGSYTLCGSTLNDPVTDVGSSAFGFRLRVESTTASGSVFAVIDVAEATVFYQFADQPIPLALPFRRRKKMFEVLANEATAARRRVYFHLVGTDGVTVATGEAGGQPQISTNGGAWSNTNIGVLSHIGNGRYYADVAQAGVTTAGDRIEVRYKSANTAECPGDSIVVIANNPYSTYVTSLSAAESTVVNSGTAQAGAAGTITLATGASATDGRYVGCPVKITSGTGSEQMRVIASYVGATRVATVDRNWDTTPDNTSVYAVMAQQAAALNAAAQAYVGTMATDTISAAAISAAGATKIAGAVYSRDVDLDEATMPEHCLGTVILASLESSRSSTTWTIKRTDGVTTHVAKTLTLTAGADPVTGVT